VHLSDAYAACAELARTHYENFPVASRLLPPHMRPHVAAVYAFARVADDFADEDRYPNERRLALLDSWLERLVRESERHDADVSRPVEPGEPANAALIFAAVGHSIRTCALPIGLFEDLISAFRQDVTVRRYATWNDVFDYCRRSANPVGRLVLRIAGYRDSALEQSADAVCTALQLTNFWQDLAIDWRRGRLYVPTSERDRAGAAEADLDAGVITPAWHAALERAVSVTRDLYDQGRPVCDGVGGRLRYELRATWLGGVRILERLERCRFNVFTSRPALGWHDAPHLLWNLLTWRARTQSTHVNNGAPGTRHRNTADAGTPVTKT
jgi:squalene synthase HpnC